MNEPTAPAPRTYTGVVVAIVVLLLVGIGMYLWWQWPQSTSTNTANTANTANTSTTNTAVTNRAANTNQEGTDVPAAPSVNTTSDLDAAETTLDSIDVNVNASDEASLNLYLGEF